MWQLTTQSLLGLLLFITPYVSCNDSYLYGLGYRVFPRFVYFEQQQHLFCGKHAVNNLLGKRATQVQDFEYMARFLEEGEGALLADGLKDPSTYRNRHGSGDYSVSVLDYVLQEQGLNIHHFVICLVKLIYRVLNDIRKKISIHFHTYSREK